MDNLRDLGPCSLMKRKSQIFKIVVILIVVIGVPWLMFLKTAYQARQARFNIDMMGRFVEMYYDEHKRYPSSLSQVPRINVVSYGEGLLLDSNSFKDGTWRGYHYDYHPIAFNQFVLSASPVGFSSPKIEFGITEQRILKFNTFEVDKDADSYEEVNRWQNSDRLDSAVTRR